MSFFECLRSPKAPLQSYPRLPVIIVTYVRIRLIFPRPHRRGVFIFSQELPFIDWLRDAFLTRFPTVALVGNI